MTEKEIFIQNLKNKTKRFAVDSIKFVESEYWLEIISEAELSKNTEELTRLLKEANEINRIMSKAKDSSYNRQ